MVYRVYVSKKEGYNNEDKGVLADLRNNLGITSVKKVKIFNRYDVENIEKDVFDSAVKSIFSEMQVDDTFDSIKLTDRTFAVELLPGQFDQRADSAQQLNTLKYINLQGISPQKNLQESKNIL